MSTTSTAPAPATVAPGTPARRRPARAGRTRPAARARRGLLYATLIALLAVFVFPLGWALSGSFKERGDIFSLTPIPDPATTASYDSLLSTQPFWNWFAMSVGTATLATVVSVFVCALAGYGFAKFRFRGRQVLFTVMFSSLSIPFAVILVPLFILVVKSGLSTPWFALVVPWVAPAFGIFLMQQFIVQGVPDEVIEAARIDGATEFGIFWRIVLPLLRPPSARWGCGASCRPTTASCGRWSSSPTRTSSRCRWASTCCSARRIGPSTS
ncbi:carbohydrate ABC transporter permease [Litorihabitans aurantiacus]|uniref:ABC transmembrane type-1 domain-containing protein n=1 Tax=Litorihabitans aurantiacus TaxID=1930061 RepID=A0AA37XHC4_9MICO|nr:carbohydrate ABC transporter permease [Litorihabitans aurantiacus]GMA33362.1 hypothetical protein GCM10025875_33540 [Litorihabitans aurantiacus]